MSEPVELRVKYWSDNRPAFGLNATARYREPSVPEVIEWLPKCETCKGSGIHLEDHGQGMVESLGCLDCHATGLDRSVWPSNVGPA